VRQRQKIQEVPRRRRRSMSAGVIDTVVFDLGNVLVDWDPRYLYRKLISDEKEMEHFLAHICNMEWNVTHDGGKPFADGIAELSALHPEKAPLIRAYLERWPEMMSGEVAGTPEILEEIRRNGRHKIYALSNWSAETFPHAFRRFGFFKHFDKIVLSGEEKLIKPDPRFYKVLESKHMVVPSRAVFIDDVQKNIDAAKALGFQTILFKNSQDLRTKLTELGVF
jgi:2-haloacid dehalogenase